MASNTILIGGSPEKQEYTCSEAITPGMLCEPGATANTMKKHATAGGAAAAIVAFEDELQGNEITDAYSANNKGIFLHCKPGDRLYMLLANGENAAWGAKLESNGDGYLRVVDADTSAGTVIPGSIRFWNCGAAVDLSDSSGADPSTYRIYVEVM
uniref:Uncharacterized protein n=1 Tax=viral metagenome TaxID=1070528 RepID=A0A6M3IQB0_9ZZZZ